MQYLITIECAVQFKSLPFGTGGGVVHPVVVSASSETEATAMAGKIAGAVEGCKVLKVVAL
jgi:hypothetical protein